MSQGTFDHIQLSAIKLAADQIAQGLGATKEKDRLIVTRAVFDMAAENAECDTAKLVAMAQQQLTPKMGWRFS